MNAQRILYKVQSNSITPLSPPHYTKNSSSISSVPPSIKWVSIKTNSLQSHQISCSSSKNKKKLLCVPTTAADRPNHDTDDFEEIVEPGISRKKLAVFVSGGGSNFRAINDAIGNGTVHGDVVALVTDKPGCGGAEYAREKGIPVILFPQTKANPEGISSFDLVSTLRDLNIVFIILAGYLKLIPVELIRAFPKPILNIHPSLLPAFGGKGYYGMKVHKAVIASGARFSGPTIHFVDEQYDTGRILAQRLVPVLANDTPEELAPRVLHEEHQLYVEVASALCEDWIVLMNDGVPLIRSERTPNEYS